MSTKQMRRSLCSHCAAVADEIRRTLIEPILTAPEDERKGYAAVLGLISAAVAVLYVCSFFVGKSKGWW